MKYPIFIASAIASISFAAHAQSVTLYGVVDSGIEFLNHADGGNHSLTRMPVNTGLAPSRVGLRGTEDLGDGLKAVFTLEGGFSTRNGNGAQGGRLFGRQSFVGLSGDWGTLSLGRQYTMTAYALIDNSISGVAIYSLGSLDNYLPNARADNSVAYKGRFGPVTVGAMYSFGRDSVGTGNAPGQGTCAGQDMGDSTQCRNLSALFRYDTAHFGMAASYEEQQGGPHATFSFFDGVAPRPLGRNGKDVRTLINAYAKFDDVKVAAGWLGRRVRPGEGDRSTVRSDLYYAGASYSVTPALEVAGEVFRIINRDHDTRATMVMLRGVYSLSKRTSTYLQGAYLTNSSNAAYSASAGGAGGAPGMGMSQIGTMVGVLHTF